jgi:LCP family protein required for cell wall assembly
MRPDDDSRDFEAPEEPPANGEDEAGAEDQDAGEHESPPPATYAGRRRAEEVSEPPVEEGSEPPAEEPEQPAAEEPHEPPAESGDQAEDAGEDVRAGFTEEFDEIERELDAELAGLDQPDDSDDEPDADEPDDDELEGGEPDEQELEDEDLDVDELDDEDLEDDDGVPEDDLELEAEGAPSGETVEAETVAIADKAEAEEAALAGLRARTAKKEAKTGVAPAAAEAPPPVAPAAVVADEEDEEEAPDKGKTPRAKRLWPRFLAASMLIVVSMAAATSVYILLIATDLAKGLGGIPGITDKLVPTDGGNPQTILILGSDKRLGSTGDPGRSDTTILLHVDPDQRSISLLSIPRDLRVNIPGVGVDKFNAAYSAGGPKLALEVVQRLTGLEINHVVNVNFTGFADAVDAIDCVYVDVDRRYYIPPETGTAEINIEAGYQRMCGFNALQYVRFRHFDNDLVRAARQQDFVREARAAVPPSKLISDREQLLDIFKKYTTSDNALKDPIQVIELIKTFYFVRNAPVSEVHFPAELGEVYVTANDKAIQQAVQQFESGEGTPGERPAGEAPPAETPEKPGNAEQSTENQPNGDNKPDKPKPDSSQDDHFEGPAMDDSTDQGQTYAHQISTKKKKDGDLMVDFPIYYPTRLVPGSFIARDTRAFVIDGPDKDVYHGYKMVVDVPGDAFGHGLLDEFYGISGTDWDDPPILENPSETRTIDGREYELFYDGDRLRLVGWKTGKGSYWVNNTLLQSLDEGQMLSIATSMREFEGK